MKSNSKITLLVALLSSSLVISAFGQGAGGAGGAGAEVSGVLTVSEGQTLYVDFGGGGKGGAVTECSQPGRSAGGGASDVRTSSGSLASRLIVAGGGGGNTVNQGSHK